MPRDANGNYTLPSGNPVVSGEVISTTWANPTMADLAVEMTSSLDRNGKGGMLAPFKFLDGNEGAPGLTFTSDPSMGIYRAGVKDMRVSVGGDKMRWTDTGIDVTPDDGTTWLPFVDGTGYALPLAFLPLAGGTLTGPVIFDGTTEFNADAQFDGLSNHTGPLYVSGGTILRVRNSTNANWLDVYHSGTNIVFNSSDPFVPHVFYGGMSEQFRVGNVYAKFTNIAVGINIVPTTPLDILGNGNATATYDDGLMIHSNNLSVWTKYSWNGISAVTTLPLAIGTTKVAELGSGGLSILNGKILALYNVGSSAGKALQIAGAANEINVTGKGAMLYFDDAANISGNTIVSTSAASGTSYVEGQLWLQYV